MTKLQGRESECRFKSAYEQRRERAAHMVQSANSLLMTAWISLSDSGSTAAVASSRTRILLLRRRARCEGRESVSQQHTAKHEEKSQTHSKTHELTLSRRKVTSSLVNVSVEFSVLRVERDQLLGDVVSPRCRARGDTYHRLDVLLEPALLQRRPDLSIGALACRVEVLPESALEALRVLRDDGKARAKGVKADLADVDAVDGDDTTLGLDDTVQHLRSSNSAMRQRPRRAR
jgi:hypothetical protein